MTDVPSTTAVGSSRPKRPKASISASVTQQEEQDLNDQDLLNEFGDGTPPSGEETPEESDTGDDEEERDERRTK